MKKFKVTITRTSWQSADFTVCAHSEEEAEDKAFQDAHDMNWIGLTQESDYEVEDLVLISDK